MWKEWTEKTDEKNLSGTRWNRNMEKPKKMETELAKSDPSFVVAQFCTGLLDGFVASRTCSIFIISSIYFVLLGKQERSWGRGKRRSATHPFEKSSRRPHGSFTR